MADHLRPWDVPSRALLSFAATGKLLVGHQFPTFYNSPSYWSTSGWVYTPGVAGTELDGSGNPKHPKYGGFVRSQKNHNSDTATGYRIRNLEHEIRLAIEGGLDGFVHNLVDATPGSTFARRWLDLAEAAENVYAAGDLGDFRIALCPDGNTRGTPRNAPNGDPTDLDDLIVEHEARNSVLRMPMYDNKQLLFSYSAATAPNGTSSSAAAWWNTRKTNVAARGAPVVFAAIFQASWTAAAPAFAGVADIMGRWGGSDWSSVTGANNDNANAAAHAMATYGVPWCHWSRWQDNRPYSQKFWEAWGSTLLRNTWNTINGMSVSPMIVQSVTWDDYSEGTEFYPDDEYIGFSPLDVQQYHSIKWKLGSHPTIVRDGLFLFHRVQPRAGNGAGVTYTSSSTTYPQTLFQPTTPDSGGAGKDDAEVLCYLKAPATVYLQSGAADPKVVDCPAGETSVMTALATGTVRAWAVRNGVTVANISSPRAVSTVQLVQNHKYTATQFVAATEGGRMPEPTDVTGLIGQWESDTLSGLADGASVTLWPSDGLYGPDLDDVGTTAPVLDKTIDPLSGNPGVVFAAGRNLRQITTADLTGYTSGLSGATLVAVCKLNSTPSVAARIAVVATGVAGAGASRYALTVPATTPVPQFVARRVDGLAASTVAGASSIGTTPHLLLGKIDYGTTTQRVYQDGVQVGSSTSALTSGTTSTDSTGVGIGSHPGNTSEGFPGPVFAVLLYDHSLTAAEQATINAWAAAKYGLAIAGVLGGVTDVDTHGATAALGVVRHISTSGTDTHGATAAAKPVRKIAAAGTDVHSAVTTSAKQIDAAGTDTHGATSGLTVVRRPAASGTDTHGATASITPVRRPAAAATDTHGATATLSATRTLAASATDAHTGAAASGVGHFTDAAGTDVHAATASLQALRNLLADDTDVHGATAGAQGIRSLSAPATDVHTATAATYALRSFTAVAADTHGAAVTLTPLRYSSAAATDVHGASSALRIVLRYAAAATDAHEATSVVLNATGDRPLDAEVADVHGALADLHLIRGLEVLGIDVHDADATLHLMRGLEAIDVDVHLVVDDDTHLTKGLEAFGVDEHVAAAGLPFSPETWPDVLGALIAELDSAALTAESVRSRRPDPMPATWLQARQSQPGSAVVPARYRCVIDVIAWAPNEPTAMDLAQLTRAAIWDLRGTLMAGYALLYSVEEVQAPRVLDDALTGRTRAWATYALVVRSDLAVPAVPE